MAAVTPFNLPESVLDAAMAELVAAVGAARDRALVALVARFPEHEAGLRALAEAYGRADQALGEMSPVPIPESLPQFDGYRVVQKLGEGAFGVVYLCEQSEPFERQVAIKLLRAGAGDRSTLARFEAERRFLARLRHPAIAHIHDAGMLADGRPWFVMEYVDGVPITAWCDRARMAVEARLRLFVRLCHGVQHAHEQDIVHRDLKPSNVLVCEIDGEAQPKIIDFGIARVLQRPVAGDEPRTEIGRIVGTPGYMSPEQSAGRLDEIDARSDVWSLGVLLYELLTSTLPWGKCPATTDSEPVRPSQRLVAAQEQLTAIAERRATDHKRLAATVRGDLDWIVLKALSRERLQRYPTALELAADVLRHLRGEAVLAGPPSWRYRLRKFVRRHRVAFSTAGCAVALAVGAWALTGYRAEAEANARTAAAAARVLLVRARDPSLAGGPGAARLRQTLIGDALAMCEHLLRQSPSSPEALAGRCDALETLAHVQLLLGQLAQSEALARKAVAAGDLLLQQRPDDPYALRLAAFAEERLGLVLGSQVEAGPTLSHFQRAVDLFERAHASQPELTVGPLVKALLELSWAVGPEARVTALARAVTLQEEVYAKSPGAAATLLIDALTAGARCDVQRGERACAEQRLQRAQSVLNAHGAAVGFAQQVKVHGLQADLAADRNDLTAARRHRDEQIAAAKAWCDAEPRTAPPHRAFSTAWQLLIDQQVLHGEAATASRDAAIAAAAMWAERLPADPTARWHYAYAVEGRLSEAWVTGRRQDLVPIEPLLRRACAWLAPAETLPEKPRRAAAWRPTCQLGLVASALDLGDRDAVWRDATAALEAAFADAPPPEAERGEAIMFCLRIIERHFAAGRDAEARQWLDRVGSWEPTDAPPEFDNEPRADRLRSLAALRRSAWQEATEHAERAGAGDHWRAAVDRADATFAIWDAVRSGNLERAETCRVAAFACCEAAIDRLLPDLQASPDNPWTTVPLSRLRIRRAEALAGHGEINLRELQGAVEAYEAAGPIVHANEWDAVVLQAGRALLAR